MTRPPDAADRFVAALDPALRARLALIRAPLMQIVPCQARIALAGVAGVIFTSANGVRFADLPAATIRSLPAYCVGRTTAEAAQDAGWQVVLTCPDADHLVAALTDARPVAPLLHLRGAHARGEIAGRLTAAGIETGAAVVYDQVLLPLSPAAQAALAGPEPVIVPLFSPRTARHFADICGDAARPAAPLFLGAISPAAAEPVENLGAAALEVAKTPDAAGMAVVVERLAERSCRVEGPGGAQ
ncbi:uroporphyrinogen-III synthase [Pseudodonghicola sp. IC7]|uniref:Uroporphyrinogen-III synthase n=2 Tax=Pseudodonghicola flavimaris TaxID=3050036 RepID=A0ABT7EZP3_9RHOB|nr:uroporphyrinogen-III synthase [Pseudodonghicola flavimaris]